MIVELVTEPVTEPVPLKSREEKRPLGKDGRPEGAPVVSVDDPEISPLAFIGALTIQGILGYVLLFNIFVFSLHLRRPVR